MQGNSTKFISFHYFVQFLFDGKKNRKNTFHNQKSRIDFFEETLREKREKKRKKREGKKKRKGKKNGRREKERIHRE